MTLGRVLREVLNLVVSLVSNSDLAANGEGCVRAGGGLVSESDPLVDNLGVLEETVVVLKSEVEPPEIVSGKLRIHGVTGTETLGNSAQVIGSSVGGLSFSLSDDLDVAGGFSFGGRGICFRSDKSKKCVKFRLKLGDLSGKVSVLTGIESGQ